MDARTCFDTVLFSDVHLGSEVSRAKEALRTLKTISFRRLILLGDIFSDLDFARLKKEHWQFLGYIRKLSNPKRNVDVVWVEGNHDAGLTEVMSHLVGIPVYQEYAWEFQGISHLAIHGHQFDRFVSRNPLLSAIGSSIYLNLQKLDFSRKHLTRLIDRCNTSWLRMTTTVSAGALTYARSKGIRRIFCGHTHMPMSIKRDGIEYFNTGCWVQNNSTFVAIDATGVRIHPYVEPSNLDQAASLDLGDEVPEPAA